MQACERLYTNKDMWGHLWWCEVRGHVGWGGWEDHTVPHHTARINMVTSDPPLSASPRDPARPHPRAGRPDPSPHSQAGRVPNPPPETPRATPGAESEWRVCYPALPRVQILDTGLFRMGSPRKPVVYRDSRKTHWSNADFLLDQRLRRWPSIKSALNVSEY